MVAQTGILLAQDVETMQCEMAQKAINNYKGNIQKKRLDLSERFPQSGSQSNNPPC